MIPQKNLGIIIPVLFNGKIIIKVRFIVIEHNMDIIKMADYIIDMGPEGGKGGGQILVTGTPEEVIREKSSYTAKYLKDELHRS